MISLETPQRKWASSSLEGRTSWISRVEAGALDLRRGRQGPPLVASGKASPHASCSGASRDSSPVDAGAYLLISWLQSPSAVILKPQKIKSDTVSTGSPSIFHEVMGPDAMIFVF